MAVPSPPPYTENPVNICKYGGRGQKSCQWSVHGSLNPRFNVVSAGSLRQEFPTIDATLYLGINEHIESVLHTI